MKSVPAFRWKRFYPDGSRYEFSVRLYPPPGYPVAQIAYWHPHHGWCGDWTACAECGCVEEAGGHHRVGCSLREKHLRVCSWCREHPNVIPAEKVS